MKNNKIKIILVSLLIVIFTGVSSYAYFERGTVKVNVGQQNINIIQGSTSNVTVSLSPGEDRQLPGCGMAECPQVCGEKDCLDENNNCTCAGLDYQTYRSEVIASTSNTGIATASYGNGVLSVRGVSPGTATITLTGSLRQHRSSSNKVTVVVDQVQTQENKPSPKPITPDNTNTSTNTNPSKDTKPSISSNPSSPYKSNSNVNSSQENTSINKDEVEVVSIPKSNLEENDSKSVTNNIDTKKEDGVQDESLNKNEEDTQNKEQLNKQDEEQNIIDSPRGTVKIVGLKSGVIKSEEFNDYLKEHDIVTFERKNSSGNVLYSWTFGGKGITVSEDIDMNIDITGSPGDELLNLVKGKNALFLSFSHHGELPSEAEIYINVSDKLSSLKELNLYYYNEEKKEMELVETNLKVENGYTNFKIDHCSTYILAEDIKGVSKNLKNEDSKSKDSNIKKYLAIGVIVLSLAASFVINNNTKKSKKND